MIWIYSLLKAKLNTDTNRNNPLKSRSGEGRIALYQISKMLLRTETK